jgi:hypothetical protein
MLTINDFELLLGLEAESGYHLCQGVPYCFGSLDADRLVQEKNVEGLAEKLIESYVGLLSRPLNHYLRQEPPRTEQPLLDAFGSMLNRSLDYVLSFDNAIVYRNEMTGWPEQLHEWFTSHIGEVVEFPNFISTYSNREYWKSAEPNFRIQTKDRSKGRNISAHVGKSMRLKESEVLFQSNARFRIIAVDDIIHLQETDEEPVYMLWEGYFYNYNSVDDEEAPSLSDLGEI